MKRNYHIDNIVAKLLEIASGSSSCVCVELQLGDINHVEKESITGNSSKRKRVDILILDFNENQRSCYLHFSIVSQV